MTTYNTGKPPGSTDPKDLFDNAENLDIAVNTKISETWQDRFGKSRKTWKGMENGFSSLMTMFSSQQDDALYQFHQEEIAALSRVAEELKKAISASGYITVESFEDGANLTLWNQVLRLESTGVYYRWDGALPKSVPAGSTPESAGGIGNGAWLSVLDATLMSQLSSDGGAALIGVAGGQTLQQFLNMIKPFIRVGAFAVGGSVNDEYDTFYSHTDEHGNEYWWSYIGSSPFPVSVTAGSVPDLNWMLVISDDFKAPLSPELNIDSISAVTDSSVTYNVIDTSSFVVGKYAFISSTVRDGQWYGGVFKILNKTSTTIEIQQSNAKITASGTTLLGECKIRAMNFSISSPGGVTANGFVRHVEGILFDGNGTASYGLMLGGGHNNTGVMRNSASIGSLRQCA